MGVGWRRKAHVDRKMLHVESTEVKRAKQSQKTKAEWRTEADGKIGEPKKSMVGTLK